MKRTILRTHEQLENYEREVGMLCLEKGHAPIDQNTPFNIITPLVQHWLQVNVKRKFDLGGLSSAYFTIILLTDADDGRTDGQEVKMISSQCRE